MLANHASGCTPHVCAFTICLHAVISVPLFSNCRSGNENKGKQAEFPTGYRGKLGKGGTLANTLSEPCSHHVHTDVNQRATPLPELFEIQLIILRRTFSPKPPHTGFSWSAVNIKQHYLSPDG